MISILILFFLSKNSKKINLIFIKSLYDVISVFENHIDTLEGDMHQILSSAKQQLADAQNENSAFSLMMICAVRDTFRF